MEKRLLGSYRNGNYTVAIYEDGTKVRETEGDSFIPSFAENIVLKITNKRDGACPWCYDSEIKDGDYAPLMAENEIETIHKYIRSLRPGTEVLIDGNDLSHPEILAFLVYLRKRRIISNLVISQKYFIRNYHRLLGWTERGLIHSLEVSLSNSEDEEFLEKIKHFPNAIIRVISGIFNGDDFDNLEGKNLKLMILGYRDIGLGEEWEKENSQNIKYNKEWLEDALSSEFPGAFRAVLFDKAAIEQLGIKEKLDSSEFGESYKDNDEDFTFYIDAVSGTYAKNSMASKEKKYSIGDKTADRMFRDLRRKA